MAARVFTEDAMVHVDVRAHGGRPISADSSLHLGYNRLISPHPLEYVLLANHFGTAAAEAVDRVGPVKPYRQHYFEGGVIHESRPKVTLEVNAFYHRGTTPFEYREISIT